MKNYTSTVPAMRSMLHIEEALVKSGAINISKHFTDGKVNSFFFQINYENNYVSFKLPANVQACYTVLKTLHKRAPRSDIKLKEQAERTAWKVLSDWVDIQLSLIEMKQAEFIQIFLPYAMNNNKTIFECLKQSEFKLLSEH
jgi:hypothetical protein